MCGCEAHHDFTAPCTCSCPEHEIFRNPKKEPTFDFSINLYDISAGKLAEVREAIETAVSPTDDISYSTTNREIYDV